MAAMNYLPYPAYRDSGVEWLGKIPDHWSTSRLKFFAEFRDEKLYEKPNDDIYLGLENIESWTGKLLLDSTRTEVESSVNIFEAGDILFGKLRPYLAKVAYPDFSGVTTTEILPLYPKKELERKYLFYLLLSEGFIRSIDSLTYGTKMPRASSEDIGNMIIPIPSLPEQRAIADFLDRETARIDALIARYQRLIELLDEKRAAIISQAVTKGLDVSKKIPCTRTPLFGDIPSHWVLSKIKFVCSIRGRIGFRGYTTDDLVGQGEGSLVLGATQIDANGLIDITNPAYISWEKYYESPEIMVSEFDVLMVQRGSTTGKVGYVQKDFGFTTINPSLVIFKNTSCESKFLFYWLSSKQIQGLAKSYLESTAIPMLSQELIGQWPILIPPYEVQIGIVNFIDESLFRIDTTIEKVVKSIQKLLDFRSSLISSTVTGKIKVTA